MAVSWLAMAGIAMPAFASDNAPMSLARQSTPIVLGAEDDWFPYSGVHSAGPDKGQPAGFAVDVVRAAFRAAGVPIKLKSLPYTRCMKMTLQHELAGCFDTLRNPLLEAQYRWHSKPLFLARINIYAREQPDEPLVFKDLYSKRIAVTNGYDYGAAFDGEPRFVRDVGTSDLHALRKLKAGRVDVALVYDRIFQHLLRQHPELSELQPVGTLIEPALYISFSKNHPDAERAQAAFERGFEMIHQSGEYARIDARWR